MDEQIRMQINEIIQKLPENKLKHVLDYILKVEKSTNNQKENSDYLKKIFDEDAELLEKLAQ